MKPHVSNLYWFPMDDLRMSRVEQEFTLTPGQSEEREWSDLDEDPKIMAYRVKSKDGRQWVGLPRGLPQLVASCVRDRKKHKGLPNRQTDAKVKMPLKMTGQYHDYQIEGIKEMTARQRGCLVAPPRMGKTVIGVGILAERRQKSLVLAHQTDLIEQFLNQTINNPSLFNGADHPGLAGVCSKFADFERHGICLATYQTFLSSKGQKLLAKVKDMFGLVLVDELHRAPATRYAQILSEFSARHMYGLTATPDRKDGLFRLAELIIGPVAYEIGRERVLSPKVYGHQTKLKMPARMPKTWVGLNNWLFSNKRRNAIITAAAKFDVANGHHVLIPVNRVRHADVLEKMINEAVGSDVCFKFTGAIPKDKRQQARDRMRGDGKIKVTLAMRSMLLGMDVPRWSAIYTVAPISNKPTYTQEVFRICTPMEGKRRPIVRYFADLPLGVAYGCLATCAKTLTDPKNNFEVTDKFKALMAAGNVRKDKVAFDDDDARGVHKASHGQMDLGLTGGMRL